MKCTISCKPNKLVELIGIASKLQKSASKVMNLDASKMRVSYSHDVWKCCPQKYLN